jgi:hypothetical protein
MLGGYNRQSDYIHQAYEKSILMFRVKKKEDDFIFRVE